jgi:hypothetical protein
VIATELHRPHRLGPAIGLTLAILLVPTLAAAQPISGAIFTTESVCDGTNVNIFADKDDVYLDGGPAHEGAAGLPDGEYYVKVTEPNGDLLGTSIGSGDDTPAVVVGGEFAACYQLSAILIRASGLPGAVPGYDDTGNAGGEYKVWVSQDAGFANSQSKTDNFKVDAQADTARLEVIKFYDANVNGLNDDGQELAGWKIHIADGTEYIRFTPVDIILDPDDYTVCELDPIQPNWVATTDKCFAVSLAAGGSATVEFGNVCLGGGGGHTLGYWSNKNGRKTMEDGGSLAPELADLSALNLCDGAGAAFDPLTYDEFRSWLLSANATNMSYMLSAQLAAMALNVEAGFVDGGALVWSPELGFISIDDLVAGADAALLADCDTPAGDPNRDLQEALKDALDAANNNQNFVQATPCPFSFPE